MNNCLLSKYFCIILNLYRNPLLVSFIDQCYSSRSAAHDIIFTSLRRAHCRLSTTIAVELNRKLEFDPHDQMFISIAVYYYQYLQKKKLFRGNRFFHDYYFLISAILICFSISILLKPWSWIWCLPFAANVNSQSPLSHSKNGGWGDWV